MISDSYFEQGSTHEVCEDYAVHGESNGKMYSIVSDGCSNGGGPKIDSDWGSRILCKSAEEFIEFIDDNPEAFINLVSNRSKNLMLSLPNLSPACLTATLMVLHVCNDAFKVLTIGDGVVGGKKKDGTWTINVIKFPRGPFYLKYKTFKEEQNFVNEFGNKYVIESYSGDIMSPEMAAPENPKYEERMIEWKKHMRYSQNELVVDLNHPYNTFEFPVSEYEFVFVCSDGIESFSKLQIDKTSKHNESICVCDALRVVMEFVNIRQSFARIQRKWAFKQDKAGTLLRRKWKNTDDVSVGVIHV